MNKLDFEIWINEIKRLILTGNIDHARVIESEFTQRILEEIMMGAASANKLAEAAVEARRLLRGK